MRPQLLSQRWIDDTLGTDWVTEHRANGPVTLRSRSFSDPSRGIFLSRECVLDVPGKFFAETLLVYPQTNEIFPIFGSEYIRMGGDASGRLIFTPYRPKTTRFRPISTIFPLEPSPDPPTTT